MAAPILPTPDNIITPAIDAIVALRPESLAHFNAGGQWSHLPKMWRAQAVLALSRLADEVKSARLDFATGQSLRTLAASEFNTTLPPDPQVAYGTVILSRPAPSVGTAPPGIIASGPRTQWTKIGRPDGIPLPATNAYPLPIASATYNTVAPVYVAPGQLTARVQIVATTPGAQANVPTFINTGYSAPTIIQPSKPLFDPTFVVTGANTAGGSSGVTDPVLRAAAKAHAIGQFGPTDGAIVASLLEEQAVRHYAAFPANTKLAYAQVYATDESWGADLSWTSRVAQHFADNWQGFGCRARFGLVLNQQIAISPTISVVDSDSLNYTEAIDVNVRAAAESYFNDRPDWYSWRLAGLRAAIAASDARILRCSNVTVTDAATGATLSEPTNALAQFQVFQTSWSAAIVHYYLTDSGVTSTYMPPS